MLYNGAIGQTAQDLSAFLTFQQNRVNGQEINLEFKELLSQMNATKPNEYLLRYANRVLAQYDFQILESYTKILKTYFDADIEAVNFEKDSEGAVIKVNDWIKNMTNNTIEKLIDDKLDKETKLVLLNALYFKGLFSNY
jgi:serine protease inhibitor